MQQDIKKHCSLEIELVLACLLAIFYIYPLVKCNKDM